MSEIEIKKLIVESATKFFSKYGYHKTTMDEIAKQIHKAKGVLYYYFKNKEELFNEVLKQELNTVKSELSKIVNSNTDSMDILRIYMLTRLKLLNKAVNYHETLKADFFEKYNFVKDVRDDFTEFDRNHLTIILKKGMDEGYLNIKDLNSTVIVNMMVLNAIEIPLFLQNKYTEYENTIDELASMLVNSLRTTKQ